MDQYSDFSAKIKQAKSLLSEAFCLISKLPLNNPKLPSHAVTELRGLHQWSETILRWVLTVSNNSTDKNNIVLDFEVNTFLSAPLPSIDEKKKGMKDTEMMHGGEDISEVEQHTMDLFELLQNGPTPQKFHALQATIGLHGYMGTPTIRQKSGVVSMINGYELISEQEMYSALNLHPIVAHSPTKLADHFDTLQSQTTDLKSHIITAEKELLLCAFNDNIIRWVNSVIRNVESIRLSKKWDELGDEHRALLFTRIASTVIIPPQHISDLGDNRSRSDRSTAHYEELMSRRKILQDLYSKLGPTVLLDPSVLDVTADTLLRRSKFYHEVYPEISQELEGMKIGKDDYWRRRSFTLQILKLLSSSTVVKFVTDFLDESRPDGVGHGHGGL